MNRKKSPFIRLYVLEAALCCLLLVYVGVLLNIQVVHHEDYLAQSSRSISRVEAVEAARGIITDRNGLPLVTNRSTYSLTFDASLLKTGQDKNEAILRLVQLCQEQQITWTDNLPISHQAPYTYTLDASTTTQRSRFLSYLRSLNEPARILGAYLLTHPAVLATEDEEGNTVNPAQEILDNAALSDTDKGEALLEALPGQNLTGDLLNAAGLPPQTVLQAMREALNIPEDFSLEEARLTLGVQYELALRQLGANNVAYVLADDIDVSFISLLSDGNYAGAKVIQSSVREYETTYAAHVLGPVGRISDKSEYEDLPGDYSMDDWIGKSGVELAFEQYLKGTDGTRVVLTNSDGKVTEEYYQQDPQPGNTVELTLDLHLQEAVEDALALAVENMNEEDGQDTRGAGAAVIKVGTGEVLALASYPTYDLSTYSQTIAELSTDPARPMSNRATSGRYAPGSTFKPLTAVAALEEGVVTTTERVRDPGYWDYPDIIAGAQGFRFHCWNRGGHGLLNITQAITASCNTFFCEMGYRLGIEALDEYATAFGLGQHTGIEIGDSAGILAGPEYSESVGQTWYGGNTVQAAVGQSDHLFTPIQLANYIATLVSGGKHCQAHLLKTVKSYDSAEILATGNTDPLNVINISDSTLAAVKEGMGNLVDSTLSGYFRECVVDAGAKTGTAQLGGGLTNNGVFVCFAPFDEPEIALAIVIEKGNSGAALASTAVKIINAYFSSEDSSAAVLPENQLLP